MILISVQPFNPRRVFSLIIALICASSAAAFAQSTLVPVAQTPYDHQMTRVEPVLEQKAHSTKSTLSLAQVNGWIGDLRAIPYGFYQEWKTPSEVEAGPVADCKGKAVALYDRMTVSGAHNVRLVIGKRTSSSRKTHAWLEWSTASGSYVLDPTINWAAVRAQDVGTRNYLPLYAFSGAHKFRATTGVLFAKN